MAGTVTNAPLRRGFFFVIARILNASRIVKGRSYILVPLPPLRLFLRLSDDPCAGVIFGSYPTCQASGI